tara:strand:+ start:200 stop:394 length:195 start_codon:yes stop_codon:yes gene_type:complete
MDVFIEAESKNQKIKFTGTVSQLLEKLNVNPETVLVSKNNELVTKHDTLDDADEVKLLSVISGG